jgi:hypothetical protein
LLPRISFGIFRRLFFGGTVSGVPVLGKYWGWAHPTRTGSVWRRQPSAQSQRGALNMISVLTLVIGAGVLAVLYGIVQTL